MALAVVLLLLIVGSVIFHFASPWWFTPIAAEWQSIDFTINVTFWVTGLVFIAVNAFMAYCVWKFRQKEGHKAVYEPENSRLEAGLSIVTTLGVVAMLAPGLFVWATFVTVPEEATDYEVVGQQWQWSFRYPGADGILGTADTVFVSENNPLGVNPEDPNSQDDVIVNGPEMRLPVNQPVRALLRSKDVLHNYTVPQFRVKMDLVPGLVSYQWFTPNLVGEYDILCEELCGIAHFIMRGRVIVEEQADYDAWLARQPTFAETQSMAEPNVAAGEQQYAACASCHGQQGEGNEALNAPRLAGLQDWYVARQLRYYQQGVRGGEGDPMGQMMAPMAAMLSTDEAIANVSAYIGGMELERSPATLEGGNIDNGRRIYQSNCAACHLPDASGTWYTDAPNLAGMSDWYFERQINNFRSGVRGLHPQDDYGEQMVSMATAVANVQEIADVAAYIHTLAE
ncbi:MAG: c-type cytochrome [Pseudohongiellaceae bacterium]